MGQTCSDQTLSKKITLELDSPKKIRKEKLNSSTRDDVCHDQARGDSDHFTRDKSHPSERLNAHALESSVLKISHLLKLRDWKTDSMV